MTNPANEDEAAMPTVESGVMKVFLSWSGSTSKQVAQALRQWLPYMIQAVEPFMSSGDISKGDAWNDVLANELLDSEYGLICVTPFNISHPWLLFEAGAMSRHIGKKKVAPVLYGVTPSALDHGPLSQFQSTDLLCRDDLLRLIGVLNRSESIHSVQEELLEATFDHWWTQLSGQLGTIQPDPTETSTPFRWLRSLDDVHRLDLSDGCLVVWIVTQNVYKYVLGDRARAMIDANLRGRNQTAGSGDGQVGRSLVRYRCMYPKPRWNSDEDHEADLRRLREKYPTAFDYCPIDHDDFVKEAATDYVIFDYAGREPRAFVRAPVGGTDDYWFDAEASASSAFQKRFSALWDRETASPRQTDANGA
jgi:hypothetical protein